MKYRTKTDALTDGEVSDSILWCAGRLYEIKRDGLYDVPITITDTGMQKYRELVAAGFIPIFDVVRESLMQEGCPEDIVDLLMCRLVDWSID